MTTDKPSAGEQEDRRPDKTRFGVCVNCPVTSRCMDNQRCERGIIPANARHPDAGAVGVPLFDAITEYARDLRRNSSGGDDYPWEIMRGVADYLDTLLKRYSPPVAGAEVGVETWIKKNFSGHGRAVRLQSDAPIPGEPFMSMEDAKELVRQAVAAFRAFSMREGWQLVPTKPTPAMHDAGYEISLGPPEPMSPDFPKINGDIYRAMLAVAPPPPVAERGVTPNHIIAEIVERWNDLKRDEGAFPSGDRRAAMSEHRLWHAIQQAKAWLSVAERGGGADKKLTERCWDDLFAHLDEASPGFARKWKERLTKLRSDLAERGGGGAWRPIETAPTDVRILVHNELWDETHGAVQIAVKDFDGRWVFDSELIVDDITQDDIDFSDDEPLSPADFLPQGWQRLPDYSASPTPETGDGSETIGGGGQSKKCPNCHDANSCDDYEGPTCEVCMGTGRVPRCECEHPDLCMEAGKCCRATLVPLQEDRPAHPSDTRPERSPPGDQS